MKVKGAGDLYGPLICFYCGTPGVMSEFKVSDTWELRILSVFILKAAAGLYFPQFIPEPGHKDSLLII